MEPKPGDKVGPYELVSAIGKGGMGEVWRARDPRLGRDVAIKVSAQQFTDRFEREARAIAALNHPNICTLFDVGHNYLVMEYIEGPTLAERIKEGPIPLEEALGYAKQIADALEAAHEKNIVHRDLKPGNVKIRPDGSVKVLDFGLAKSDAAETTVTHDSPTLMHSPTMVGVILGTAAYMAPEQARGKTVDKRADIWSFGVVLYEMLTGKRLFEGEDLTETLASVVKSEPNLAPVPRKVRRLLAKCLEKDPKKRLRDIGDAWELIEEAPPEAAASRPQLRWAPWIAAAVLAAALAALAFVHFREKRSADRVVRLSVALPENAVVRFLSLSPDGRRLALSIANGNDSSLYVRSLDSGELQQLPETKLGWAPFWSPDSRFIAYFDENKLKVIPAAGGPARTLCGETGLGDGGSWSAGGLILFSDDKGLRRVDSNGGDCIRVGREDTSDSSAYAPTFLPDGKHFFYERFAPASDQTGVYLATLESPEGRRVLADKSAVIYTPPAAAGGHAHLLFIRDNALMAQPLDSGSLQAAGDPFTVARPAVSSAGLAQPAATASADGTLVYLTGGLYSESQITWFDRTGKELGKAGPREIQFDVKLSPDGNSVLTLQQHRDVYELWLYDLTRNGSASRLTRREDGTMSSTVWSPDSTRVMFYLGGGEGFGLYLKDIRNGQEELIAKPNPSEIRRPSDLSRDGRYLIYTDVEDPKKQGDIWYLPLEAGKPSGPPVMLAGTTAMESQGQLSPDGKWLAYYSDESGMPGIYVRPFPSGPGVWKVSVHGGREPRWGADGRELFFIEIGSGGGMSLAHLMAATAKPDGHGGLGIGTPQELFDYQASSITPTFNVWTYSPHPDGKRFLVNEKSKTDKPAVNVILHWQKAVGEAK